MFDFLKLWLKQDKSLRGKTTAECEQVPKLSRKKRRRQRELEQQRASEKRERF